jgi:hypothetical protein
MDEAARRSSRVNSGTLMFILTPDELSARLGHAAPNGRLGSGLIQPLVGDTGGRNKSGRLGSGVLGGLGGGMRILPKAVQQLREQESSSSSTFPVDIGSPDGARPNSPPNDAEALLSTPAGVSPLGLLPVPNERLRSLTMSGYCD